MIFGQKFHQKPPIFTIIEVEGSVILRLNQTVSDQRPEAAG